eukprot:COSAG01_NODE_7774_length_3063_cov_2.191970_1_plen_34_part_10
MYLTSEPLFPCTECGDTQINLKFRRHTNPAGFHH